MPINLRITSTVGFYNSSGVIIGPEPWIQTSLDLEGANPYNVPKPRKILTVSTLTDFYIVRGTTATAQTVTLSNPGSDFVNVRSIEFTRNGLIPLVRYGEEWSSNGTVTIPPNSSVNFDLSYFGANEGNFTNSFIIRSDAKGGSYLSSKPLVEYIGFTTQTVDNRFYFRLTPTSAVTTSTYFGQLTGHLFAISEFNGTTSSYSISLTGSPGFSVASSSTSRIRVIFDNNAVNDVNGTYTANLLVSAFGGTTSSSVSLSHTINIDPTQFYHYGDWFSPGAPYDSVIGISYDRIAGVRTLTIGVGAGADGAPSYTTGGAEVLSVINLGIEAATGAVEYPYWAKVYRIPLVDSPINQPRTYYSGEYQVKSVGVDYDQYFGSYGTPGSIFVIDDDGFGNLLIKINNIRELPEDEQLSVTVQNLARSFYYYSPNDFGGGRYYQLGSPTGDGTQTEMFAGFYNNGSVITFLVPYPL